MCGRFTYYTPPETLINDFFPEGLEVDGQFEAGYNIPPGVGIAMIRATMNGPLLLTHSHWGFRPVWAGSKAPTPINARAESVATSGYFREAFAHHRCLIPANGWYEWQRSESGKVPHYITPRDAKKNSTIFFAGIWTPQEGDNTTACAIITEPASEQLKHIHDRQPVVLAPDCLADWLDPGRTDRDSIRAATRRLPTERLHAYRVSTAVDNARYDSPDLIQQEP